MSMRNPRTSPKMSGEKIASDLCHVWQLFRTKASGEKTFIFSFFAYTLLSTSWTVFAYYMIDFRVGGSLSVDLGPFKVIFQTGRAPNV